ncbi:MAG TPA: DUF808 family protein [Alphaproteobacteria bacterium]
MFSWTALLDDMATLAKMAASGLDDVVAQTGKATSKAVGIVIDDTATTPQYVTGLSPKRELPIIGKIAAFSALNKVILSAGLIGAGAALGGAVVPVMTGLLTVGGAYLAYEGYEKIHEKLFHKHDGNHQEKDVVDLSKDAEGQKVRSAVITDVVLSGEIMAITFAGVATAALGTQIGVMLAVGAAMTVGVYGLVGALVKMDDIGLAMAYSETPATSTVNAVKNAPRALLNLLRSWQNKPTLPITDMTPGPVLKGLDNALKTVVQPLGHFLAKQAMPGIFAGLSGLGTAMMLAVGGGMLIHGGAYFGEMLHIPALSAPEHLVSHSLEAVSYAMHGLPTAISGIGHWVAEAGLMGVVVGIPGGIATALAVTAVTKPVKALLQAVGLIKKPEVHTHYAHDVEMANTPKPVPVTPVHDIKAVPVQPATPIKPAPIPQLKESFAGTVVVKPGEPMIVVTDATPKDTSAPVPPKLTQG